jgi:hypothetical protein
VVQTLLGKVSATEILLEKVSVSDKGRLFGKNLTIAFGFVYNSIAKLGDKAQIV